jgi:hypothetical protein
MSTYTENNFNACLEAIGAIKAQRDEAIRIAIGLEKLIEEENHSFSTGVDGCPCGICKLGKKLSDLKLQVISYQNKMRKG